MSVSAQAFGLPKRNRGRTKRTQLLRAAFKQRGALHEIQNAQPRRETGRPRGGKDVIGSCHVVANRFGCISTNKDGARVADSRNKRSSIGSNYLKMLGGELIDQVNRIPKLGHEDNRSEVFP